MNILFIEPFYSGSHKTWLNQLQKYSTHHLTLLTMDGKHWKWRMYGSAVTMADRLKDYLASTPQSDWPDLILCSDMMDLATFIALSREELNRLNQPKIGVYFHENQLTYPYKEGSDDAKLNRELHYGMINYSTALAGDFLMFNSHYNLNSFLQELEIILNKMPDYSHIKSNSTLERIKSKATVLPIAMEFKSKEYSRDTASDTNHDTPLILWNHRLEHDKNPEDFFRLLTDLKANNIPFELALLGEMSNRNLKEYASAIDGIKDHIIAQGYVSYSEYQQLLARADLLPVTSNHDFFGISVMEAIESGTYPLLPKRLTYPELYKIDQYPELFYSDYNELLEKAKTLLTNNKAGNFKSYAHLASGYDWSQLITRYDDLFNKYI